MRDIQKFNIDSTSSLQKYEKSYSQCASSQNLSSTCPNETNILQIVSLYDKYSDFFNKFDLKIKNYADQRNNVDYQLKNVPKSVAKLGSDLFGGTFVSSFRSIEPAFDTFEFDWANGEFNVLRVNLLHKRLQHICTSLEWWQCQ